MNDNIIQIDDTDKKILSYLGKNARMPFLEIARECGISGAAIHQRVKKLEDAGVIDGSRFLIKPKALGYNVCSFIGINLDHAHKYLSVVNDIQKIPEIVECHYTTGNFAMLLKLYCKDNEHLLSIIIDKLQKVQGIARTETLISLEQKVNRELGI